MDPRIRFGTKEENNARREQDFLALSPSQRVEWFLRSFNDGTHGAPDPEKHQGNFVLRKKADAVR